MLLAESLIEVQGKLRNVLEPRTKRRQLYPCDVNPVVKVRTEPARGNLVLQGTACGANHADLHGNLLPAADPGELLILQELEQFSLKRYINLVDPVQEERAHMSHLNASRLVCVRAGKGTFFIAEEFTLQ